MEKGGGCTNACICMGSPEHIVSLSCRTDRWMFMKLGRDEVFMARHMRWGFLAKSTKGWIQGGAKIGQWGAPSPKDFFLRLEYISNKPNAYQWSKSIREYVLLFRAELIPSWTYQIHIRIPASQHNMILHVLDCPMCPWLSLWLHCTVLV